MHAKSLNLKISLNLLLKKREILFPSSAEKGEGRFHEKFRVIIR